MDELTLQVRAALWKNVLETMFVEKYRDVPSYREAAIQVDKLDRMLRKVQQAFPATMILQKPRKQIAKAKGPHMARLGQQAKVVDALMAKVFTEMVFVDFPHTTPKERKRIPALSRKLITRQNDNIHQQVHKRLTEGYAAARELLSGRRKTT